MKQMHANVQDRIADCTKKERLVVMGDFNAKFGVDKLVASLGWGSLMIDV